MARIKPITVPFRRKKQLRTNYTKRLQLLLSRKSRLVVRVTNSRIIAQIIDFGPQGDKVLVGVDSAQLKKLGWPYSGKNMPAAYLTGLLIAKKAISKKVKEVILDTGLLSPPPKGKVYAFLKGAVEGGLKIPHSGEKIFPDTARLVGKHIQEYSAKIKQEKNSPVFTQYLKSKAEPEHLSAKLEEVKKKISSLN